MGFLDGKKGIVLGVANERSLAWHIAKNLMEQGAELGFTNLPGEKYERRVRKTLQDGGVTEPWLQPCDVSKDEDIEQLFKAAEERFGQLSFVVHSLAFANREYLQWGKFTETPRDAFAQALDISAYSLIPIARYAQPLMKDGGSILAMTYYGAEKVVPGYNMMGVAKAALEATSRYLAAELGQYKIRVNTLSAGPCRTLSAMAVGGMEEMFAWVERKAPLQRNIEADEVGKSAMYLLSDLSSGVTGENVHVDAGFNIVGM
jgi:enoyl-[acyl-carrier protein] reductase I